MAASSWRLSYGGFLMEAFLLRLLPGALSALPKENRGKHQKGKAFPSLFPYYSCAMAALAVTPLSSPIFFVIAVISSWGASTAMLIRLIPAFL